MVGKIAKNIRPKSGFSNIVHIISTLVVPVLLYAFVKWGFAALALLVILLSKWRIFAVRPRHWWPNIRSNAVDIIVGVSALSFVLHSDSDRIKLVWVILYGIWLVALKPKSTSFTISLQAFIGQTVGLVALFIGWGDKPLIVLMISAAAICYTSARHYFTSFDEPHAPLFSHAWGYFGAALTWVLGHWLLFYGVVAQPVLLFTVLGFGLAALYYLQQKDRLSLLLRRQLVFIMIAIIVVILVFSEWGDKTV